ncbi:hypothetical protein SAMN05660297_02276 [Natronincola peptidivorans]|uniref:Phosphoesterase n=1 Tax=Natronincola peptidivorans TaxID=426128 RepID=A0A1I0E223_9FIRM|nr:metallophosphoesterase [Natronincola peptidivorans]SET38904.1 hypothetical protein SAMN05660297_02276 [Natronincola peptidivorans]
MRIAVLGDSHRETFNIDLIADTLEEVDLVIHTGDNYEDIKYIEKTYNKKVLGVRGNCDPGANAEDEIIEEIEGKRLFISHGHKYGVKYSLSTIFYRGKEVEADIVIFGHSHVPLHVMEEDVILLNPGSISLPRGREGKTYAIVEIQESIFAEIIEL